MQIGPRADLVPIHAFLVHFQQGDVAEPFPQSLRMQLQQRAFPDPPHPAQHFDHRLERKLIQPGKVDISSMHE